MSEKPFETRCARVAETHEGETGALYSLTHWTHVIGLPAYLRSKYPLKLKAGQAWLLALDEATPDAPGYFGRLMVDHSDLTTGPQPQNTSLLPQLENIKIACDLASRILYAHSLPNPAKPDLSARLQAISVEQPAISVNLILQDIVEATTVCRNSLMAALVIAITSWVLDEPPDSSVVAIGALLKHTGKLTGDGAVKRKLEAVEKDWPHIKRLLAPESPTRVESRKVEYRRWIVDILRESGLPIGKEKEPWPGLRPYTLEEKSYFIGRQEESNSAKKRLLDPSDPVRVLALTGPSGAGKSSLMRAGIVPLLLEKGYNWVDVNLTPTVGLLEALQTALNGKAAEVSAQSLLSESEQVDAVKKLCNGRSLVFTVDQFELAKGKWLRPLLLLIVALAQANALVLLSTRDRLDSPELHSLLEKGILDWHCVGPLNPGRVAEVVRGPLAHALLQADPSIILQILARYGGERVALLNLVLHESWQVARKGDRVLNDNILNSLEDKDGPLERYASEFCSEAERTLGATGGDGKRQLKLLLSLLVRGDKHQRQRRSRRKEELGLRLGLAPSNESDFWTRLTRHRVLVEEGESIILDHDLYLEVWSYLKEAIEYWENEVALLDTLEARAADWANHTARLWTANDRELGQASTLPFHLSPLEQKFIRCSRRSALLRKWLPRVGVAVVVAVVVVLVALANFSERRRIRSRMAEALFTSSERLREVDEAESARQLLQGVEYEPDSPRRGPALQGWAGRLLRRSLPGFGSGFRPVWSPDDKRIVTRGPPGALRVWARSGTNWDPEVDLSVSTVYLTGASFSGDGKWLGGTTSWRKDLSSIEHPRVLLWSAAGGASEWRARPELVPPATTAQTSGIAWHPRLPCLLVAYIDDKLAPEIWYGCLQGAQSAWSHFSLPPSPLPRPPWTDLDRPALAISEDKGVVAGGGRLLTFQLSPGSVVRDRTLPCSSIHAPNSRETATAVAFQTRRRVSGNEESLLVGCPSGHVFRLYDSDTSEEVTSPAGLKVVSIDPLPDIPGDRKPGIAEMESIAVNWQNGLFGVFPSQSWVPPLFHPVPTGSGVSVNHDLSEYAYSDPTSGSVRLVSFASPQIQPVPFLPRVSGGVITSLDRDPNGHQLALGSFGAVTIRREDGSTARSCRVSEDFVGSVSWSPNGRELAFVSGVGPKRKAIIISGDPSGSCDILNELSIPSPCGLMWTGAGEVAVMKQGATPVLWYPHDDGRVQELFPGVPVAGACVLSAWSEAAGAVAVLPCRRPGLGAEFQSAQVWTRTGGLSPERKIVPGNTSSRHSGVDECAAAALDTSGTRLAVLDSNHGMRVIDLTTGQDVWYPQGDPDKDVLRMAWGHTADRAQLLAVARADQIRLFRETSSGYHLTAEYALPWQRDPLAFPDVVLRWDRTEPRGFLVTYSGHAFIRSLVLWNHAEVEVEARKHVEWADRVRSLDVHRIPWPRTIERR